FASVVIGGLLLGCGGGDSPPPNANLDALDPLMAQLVRRSREAVVASPKSAEAWGKLGQVFHSVDFSSEAQSCYRRAAQIDPDSPRWPHLLALLQLQEQPEEAIHNLTRAAELEL